MIINQGAIQIESVCLPDLSWREMVVSYLHFIIIRPKAQHRDGHFTVVPRQLSRTKPTMSLHNNNNNDTNNQSPHSFKLAFLLPSLDQTRATSNKSEPIWIPWIRCVYILLSLTMSQKFKIYSHTTWTINYWGSGRRWIHSKMGNNWMINDRKFLLVPSKVTFWAGGLKKSLLHRLSPKTFTSFQFYFSELPLNMATMIYIKINKDNV